MPRQILGMGGMTEGNTVTYREISGESVINPQGYGIKDRMKMTMDMTTHDQKITVTMDGDVGYANPGQPVEITVPNLAEYTMMQNGQ